MIATRDVFHYFKQLAYVWWTAIHLYILGAVYVLKELNRKYDLVSTVRHLSEDDKDLPKRLDGRVAIITGGSRGIGLEAAIILLKKGCHVIIASSAHPTAVQQLSKKILDRVQRESDPNFATGRLEIWRLDLMSLKSVQQFADRFHSSGVKNLNYLVNNAAIMFAPKKITEDGFESHFQVNYLGHCLLIWSLLPAMAKTGRRCGVRSRIVNVSSSTHFARDLCLNDLQSTALYSPFHSYATSKLCQIMFTYRMNVWLQSDENYSDFGQYVTVNSLHPGVALTELYENVWWVKLMPFLARALFRTAKEGSETIIYACLSSELEGYGGYYLEDCAIIESSVFSNKRSVYSKLWQKTWQLLEPFLDLKLMPDPNNDEHNSRHPSISHFQRPVLTN